MFVFPTVLFGGDEFPHEINSPKNNWIARKADFKKSLRCSSSVKYLCRILTYGVERVPKRVSSISTQEIGAPLSTAL
jgi:hypothetical protein